MGVYGGDYINTLINTMKNELHRGVEGKEEKYPGYVHVL